MPFTNLSKSESSHELGRKTVISHKHGVSSGGTISRIKPALLELQYIRIPLVYSAINLKATHTVSPWFTIQSDNKEAIKKIETFNRTHDMELIVTNLVKDAYVYGDGLGEVVRSEIDEDRIVDIVELDPKVMDVKLDEEGGEIYKQVTGGFGGGADLERRDIVHIRFNQVGDDPRGWGIIEPMYVTLNLWLNTERAVTNYIERHGFPKFVVTVGKEGEVVSEDRLAAIGEKFVDINEQNEFIIGNDISMSTIDGPSSKTNMKDYLDYWIDVMCSGMAVPKLLVGLGQDVNRATGSLQLESWEREIRLHQKIISSELIDKIYNPLLAHEGISCKYEIVWNDWSSEDENLNSDRLRNEYMAGLITKEEFRRDMGYTIKPFGTEFREEPTNFFPQSQPTQSPSVREEFKSAVFEGVELAEKQLNMNILLKEDDVERAISHGIDEIKTIESDEKLQKLHEILWVAYKERKGKQWVYDQIQELAPELSRYEVDRIMRTELNRVRNTAQLEAFKQSGVVQKKKWYAAMDNRTSPVCKALFEKYGQNGIPLNEEFKVSYKEGNETKTWKGQNPPAHPNCRSVLLGEM